MSQVSHTPSVTGKRILIVEDMALVAHEVEFLLKHLRCEPLGPVGRLEQALELIRQDPPDGVVLDVNLNGVESFPIADELSQLSIPFVFTTGYGAGSMPAHYKNHPRLEKPFGLQEMAEKLNEMFGAAE